MPASVGSPGAKRRGSLRCSMLPCDARAPSAPAFRYRAPERQGCRCREESCRVHMRGAELEGSVRGWRAERWVIVGRRLRSAAPRIIKALFRTRRAAMALRLGDTAPDFTQDSSEGPIHFHEWLGNSWGVLFSHPADFTPVCTTELGLTAKLKEEFAKR